MKIDLLINLTNFLLMNRGRDVVYVAGKVTGLPYEEASEKFKKAQVSLEAQGYAVLNPCEWISADADWQKAMRDCLVLIGGAADFLFLLDNWRDSEGAVLENNLCHRVGITELPMLDVDLTPFFKNELPSEQI